MNPRKSVRMMNSLLLLIRLQVQVTSLVSGEQGRSLGIRTGAIMSWKVLPSLLFPLQRASMLISQDVFQITALLERNILTALMLIGLSLIALARVQALDVQHGHQILMNCLHLRECPQRRLQTLVIRLTTPVIRFRKPQAVRPRVSAQVIIPPILTSK